MAERKEVHITRIDFAVADQSVVVNKLVEIDGRAIVIETSTKPLAELETMLTWCASHGWTVRRYAPLGARAWKGAAKPVRTAGQIQKRRAEMEKYPVPGLQVHALDFAYDC